MTSDEERLKRRSRRTRNHLAKFLEDRKFRQRKIDKKYKLLKARLQEIDLDEPRGEFTE